MPGYDATEVFAEEIAITMNAVRQYATGQFVDDVLKLCNEESEYVAGHGGCETPQSLIDNYGVSDELRESEAGDGIYECARGIDDPVEIVIVLLKEHTSWGEFLGGVISSMAKWDQATRERVMPELGRAVRWAAVNGVDH